MCLPPPTEPCYDPVHDDDDESLNVAALKRLSIKRNGSVKGLKPAAWVSASKQVSGRTPGPGSNPCGDVSLIDFGEEDPPPTPSPVVEIRIPGIAKLALESENLLDRTPPQSPCRSLPRPLHPTPVVDWDARPLPPPPAYDDVAQDEDDMEVRNGGRLGVVTSLNGSVSVQRSAPSIVRSSSARSNVPGRRGTGRFSLRAGQRERSWKTTSSSPADGTRASPPPSPSQQKFSKNSSKNV